MNRSRRNLLQYAAGAAAAAAMLPRVARSAAAPPEETMNNDTNREIGQKKKLFLDHIATYDPFVYDDPKHGFPVCVARLTKDPKDAVSLDYIERKVLRRRDVRQICSLPAFTSSTRTFCLPRSRKRYAGTSPVQRLVRGRDGEPHQHVAHSRLSLRRGVARGHLAQAHHRTGGPAALPGILP